MTDPIGTTETADLLGVSVRTVHRMVARGTLVPVGKLPAMTGAYLFDRADVIQFARAMGRAA